MADIFKKIFCLHDWNLDHETLTSWTERKVTEDTKYTLPGYRVYNAFSHRNESRIYICKKCGKIKTVNISI